MVGELGQERAAGRDARGRGDAERPHQRAAHGHAVPEAAQEPGGQRDRERGVHRRTATPPPGTGSARAPRRRRGPAPPPRPASRAGRSSSAAAHPSRRSARRRPRASGMRFSPMNIPGMESTTATSAPASGRAAAGELDRRVELLQGNRAGAATGRGPPGRPPASAAQGRSPASQWTPSPTSPATWIHLPRVSDSPPRRMTTSRSQNPGSVMERTAAYRPLPAWVAGADRSNRLVPARETRKSTSASSMGAPSLPVSVTVRRGLRPGAQGALVDRHVPARAPGPSSGRRRGGCPTRRGRRPRSARSCSAHPDGPHDGAQGHGDDDGDDDLHGDPRQEHGHLGPHRITARLGCGEQRLHHRAGAEAGRGHDQEDAPVLPGRELDPVRADRGLAAGRDEGERERHRPAAAVLQRHVVGVHHPAVGPEPGDEPGGEGRGQVEALARPAWTAAATVPPTARIDTAASASTTGRRRRGRSPGAPKK